MDININLIRKQDKITLKNGQVLEIEDAWHKDAIYQVKVNYKGKEMILTYKIDGTSLDNDELTITNFEMTELPEDSIVKYIPKFDVNLLPILNLNGEDKLIYRLLDLDGLEVKGDQVMKASYKYVIEAYLQKIKGRSAEIVKEEKIICGSKEECQEKLANIEKSITDVDNTNKDIVSKLFKDLVEKIN